MRPRAWCNLDELYAGSCDGMTYEEIEEQFPEEFERRRTDKLAYRYPRGESYLDVIARLEPMIMEMERHRSVNL
jgi:broad specificity phosphatase PhoE